MPGLGKRSAKRVALHLLKNKETLMLPLAKSLTDAAASIKTCSECGNYDVTSPCHICVDVKRDKTTICVIENISDLWAMQRGNVYNGLYHVLGGALSALDGVGPDDLRINQLLERIENNDVKEIIIATNATLEGQTTAHYIMQSLTSTGVNITRLAHGIPLGGELDYMDEGTISTALKARKAM